MEVKTSWDMALKDTLWITNNCAIIFYICWRSYLLYVSKGGKNFIGHFLSTSKIMMYTPLLAAASSWKMLLACSFGQKCHLWSFGSEADVWGRSTKIIVGTSLCSYFIQKTSCIVFKDPYLFEHGGDCDLHASLVQSQVPCIFYILNDGASQQVTCCDRCASVSSVSFTTESSAVSQWHHRQRLHVSKNVQEGSCSHQGGTHH